MDEERNERPPQQEVVERLLDRAFLYEDPDAYRAGVQAALSVMIEQPSKAAAVS